MFTVLLAIPNKMIRQTLVSALGKAGVCITVCTDHLQTYLDQDAHNQLDAILLDVSLNSARCTRFKLDQIDRLYPNCRVLLLSSTPEAYELAWAIESGANAYLLITDTDAIVKATRACLNEVHLFNRAMLKQMVTPLLDLVDNQSTPKNAPPETTFTEAERKVLNQLACGLSNKNIANELGISINTVKSHVRHILHKLMVTDRTQAALWASKHGFPEEYHPKG